MGSYAPRVILRKGKKGWVVQTHLTKHCKEVQLHRNLTLEQALEIFRKHN